MKAALKSLAFRVVRRDSLWVVLDATVIRGANFLRSERVRATEHTIDVRGELARISPQLTVLHGPFQGMRYPKVQAIGSAIGPKLIGSYERELAPVIEAICARDYSEIVDIGCAEGYYAIGLALRLPGATVFAYDTDQRARALCREMALLNGVADRVSTGSLCDADTLRALPVRRRALLLSDCEGYEKTLFSADLIPFLARHDLLIEVHDFIDIEISSVLRERFAGTHEIEVIAGVDDVRKAQTYDYPELSPYSLDERRLLLTEYRRHAMEWFYLTPIER